MKNHVDGFQPDRCRPTDSDSTLSAQSSLSFSHGVGGCKPENRFLSVPLTEYGCKPVADISICTFRFLQELGLFLARISIILWRINSENDPTRVHLRIAGAVTQLANKFWSTFLYTYHHHVSVPHPRLSFHSLFLSCGACYQLMRRFRRQLEPLGLRSKWKGFQCWHPGFMGLRYVFFLEHIIFLNRWYLRICN